MIALRNVLVVIHRLMAFVLNAQLMSVIDVIKTKTSVTDVNKVTSSTTTNALKHVLMALTLITSKVNALTVKRNAKRVITLKHV
jgi:hypothetical protein